MVEIRPVVQDAQLASVVSSVNRLVKMVRGDQGGRIWLIGDDGNQKAIRGSQGVPSGTVLSAGNYPFRVRSGAGNHIQVTHSSGAPDVMRVQDGGATIPVVSGNTRFANNVDVDGTFNADGAATLQSTLGVTGNTTLSGTLGVTGLTTLTTLTITTPGQIRTVDLAANAATRATAGTWGGSSTAVSPTWGLISSVAFTASGTPVNLVWSAVYLSTTQATVYFGWSIDSGGVTQMGLNFVPAALASQYLTVGGTAPLGTPSAGAHTLKISMMGDTAGTRASYTGSNVLVLENMR